MFKMIMPIPEMLEANNSYYAYDMHKPVRQLMDELKETQPEELKEKWAYGFLDYYYDDEKPYGVMDTVVVHDNPIGKRKCNTFGDTIDEVRITHYTDMGGPSYKVEIQRRASETLRKMAAQFVRLLVSKGGQMSEVEVPNGMDMETAELLNAMVRLDKDAFDAALDKVKYGIYEVEPDSYKEITHHRWDDENGKPLDFHPLVTIPVAWTWVMSLYETTKKQEKTLQHIKKRLTESYGIDWDNIADEDLPSRYARLPNNDMDECDRDPVRDPLLQAVIDLDYKEAERLMKEEGMNPEKEYDPDACYSALDKAMVMAGGEFCCIQNYVKGRDNENYPKGEAYTGACWTLIMAGAYAKMEELLLKYVEGEK